MALLRLNQDGCLVIEAAQEETNAERALRRFSLALVVTERTGNTLVFDRLDDVAEAVTYLLDTAEDAGFELNPNQELATLITHKAAEIEQLESARKGPQDDESPIPIPGFKLELEPLPHQVRGIGKALAVGNLAEFSVQGAGKTMTALAIFAHWQARGEVEKLLVVGPVSSFQPWEEEIAKCFAETPGVLRWSGSAIARTQMITAYRAATVVLCSYDTARRDVHMLREQLRFANTALVLDESHYVKNFEIGARGAAMFELAPHATKRLILSGTPAPHSLLDLYSQFAFLWPAAKEHLLGTPQQYLNRLSGSDSPATELRETLGPYFHRTTQDELGLREPATHTELIGPEAVPLSQSRIISLLENKLAVEARTLPRRMDRELLGQWRRARVIRLLQAASNPGLLTTIEGMPPDPRAAFDVSELTPLVSGFRDGTVLPAKVQWTVDKVKSLIAGGNKVVIWSWWVSNLHFLSELLADFNPLLLYGQIKPYEDSEDPNEVSRERNIREFKSRSDRPLLIANPSACAESISLHRVCHHAIYVDRTYNCGQFLQSLNRIHRIGLPQGAVTNYWIPVVDCAIERSVDHRLQQRQRTMYQFLGDDAPVLGVDWREDGVAVDSEDEMEAAFEDLLTELPR